MAKLVVGNTVDLAIEGLGHEGEGIGRYSGLVVFVPGAMPGDRVQVRITETKKNMVRASLLKLLEPAVGRVSPSCALAPECGGCQLQHVDYSVQLELKQRLVADALQRIGHLPNVPVLPVIGMEEPWHYRNKAQYPVGLKDGKLVMGCYAPGSHRVVDTDDCKIQHPTNTAILRVARALLRKYGISAYNEQTGSGLVRHVLARVATGTGEAMAVFIVNGDSLPHERELSTDLLAQVTGLVSVQLNINEARGNAILGPHTRVITGRDTITDLQSGLKFEISPRSFYQVNSMQTRVLYSKALQYADLADSGTAIDVYSGIGTISLSLAGKPDQRVIGIESVESAVLDARKNAQVNDLSNAEFICGLAEAVLPRLAAEGVRPEVIVVDPPRKGCEPPVLAAMAAMQPDRIVYVSCNPATLARDLAILTESGYWAVEVQPVDMFPHTAHVECVVKIERAD